MSLNPTTRMVPASNAKPQRERGKRREGLVEGEPTVPEIFSLSVTECHAAHLPLAMRRTRVDTAQATSKKRQVRPDWASSIIDPMIRRCLIESRVDRHVAKSPNALPAIRQRARQAFVKPWYASTAVTIMATQLSHIGVLQPPIMDPHHERSAISHATQNHTR
jgi:hypothetical protein